MAQTRRVRGACAITTGVEKARLAILVGPKGRGSNMRAIAEACDRGDLPAEVSVVVSPASENAASEWAAARGLFVAVVPTDDPSYEDRLSEILAESGADWICLAGYLRLLPSGVLRRLPGRVLNIHPALLPKFGGKGMYGIRVHEAVLAAHERESGCTVHRVEQRYDEGPIVLQLRCRVESDDTPESLAARVLELEHRAYVEALRIVLEADVRVDRNP